MAGNRTEPDRANVRSDPNRPAYDNPSRNKGDLAVGNNVVKPPRPAPSSKPQGHASDKVLGNKPAPG
jgi:hypothetical protein